MFGVVAAIFAVSLGLWGPRFRWKGAALLLGITLIIGICATLVLRDTALEAGLRFGLSVESVLVGFALQIGFMLALYSAAALVAWAYRHVTFRRLGKLRT